MLLNKLSGEGLFDERPSTQTSLGRFVLGFISSRKASFGIVPFPIAYGPIDATILFAGAVLQCCSMIAQDKAMPAGSGRRQWLCRASPAFRDDFSGGNLDMTKWFVDTGRAPGNIAGVNNGTLSANHVDLSTGMLRLTLTQNRVRRDGHIGGCRDSFEEIVRLRNLYLGSACGLDLCSPHAGSAASGSVTDVFNFINDSESEIDFEYQGKRRPRWR